MCPPFSNPGSAPAVLACSTVLSCALTVLTRAFTGLIHALTILACIIVTVYRVSIRAQLLHETRCGQQFGVSVSTSFLYKPEINTYMYAQCSLLLRDLLTLQTGLNGHSNRFLSMRIRTGSICFHVFTLLQTHRFKVLFITWPLCRHRMRITVRTCQRKWRFFRRLFDFVSLCRVDPHTLTRALVWSFVKPGIFAWLNLCGRTWALIDLWTYKYRVYRVTTGANSLQTGS